MVKVTVCGAAGGIGQPLSLILKQSALIDHLALYDIMNVHGVAADLSHINTNSMVTGHLGPEELEAAMNDADVVVIPAGVPRKPGMSRDDLFKINASIVRDIAVAAAKHAPNAFICVISNPVNATVPIVSEVFKKHRVYDAKRIFGITTLDVVRSSTFLAELLQQDPKDIKVPVIGGHSGYTIIPIFSQYPGSEKLTDQQVEELTKRVQFAGDEVVKAKEGNGSATLSMAYAGARFTLSLISAAFHGEGHVECAYVGLQADPEGAKAVRRLSGEVEYFAVNVNLGPRGIQHIPPVGKISNYEYKLLTAAVPELNASIAKGSAFVNQDTKS